MRSNEGKIPGGTSGSPVFNQKGEVIGLVSESGIRDDAYEESGTVVWLAGALQAWLIRELDRSDKTEHRGAACQGSEGVMTILGPGALRGSGTWRVELSASGPRAEGAARASPALLGDG